VECSGAPQAYVKNMVLIEYSTHPSLSRESPDSLLDWLSQAILPLPKFSLEITSSLHSIKSSMKLLNTDTDQEDSSTAALSHSEPHGARLVMELSTTHNPPKPTLPTLPD